MTRKGGGVGRQLLFGFGGGSAVAALAAALALLFAGPSAAADTGGCGNGNWTAVDFVYSGNYKKTGLYEFAWITYSGLGQAVQSHFALSEREAYLFGVESFGWLDNNGDQVLCVSWLGANPGQEDYDLSVVDNHARA
jgi:hypothetical protein